jgi:hypothetical protein
VRDQRALRPASSRFGCDAEHPWRRFQDPLPGDELKPGADDTAEFPCAEFVDMDVADEETSSAPGESILRSSREPETRPGSLPAHPVRLRFGRERS